MKFFQKRKTYKILSEDISGTGLGFVLTEPVEIGDKINLSIYFPEETKPVDATCVIIRCNEFVQDEKTYYRAGTKYLKIRNKDKERFVFLFCEHMLNYSIFGDE